MAIPAIILLAVACERQASVAKFVLNADFENLSQSVSFEGNDSVMSVAYINLQNCCLVVSDYDTDNSVLRRGWTASTKKGALGAAGDVTPFASAGTSAGAGKSNVYTVFYDAPSSLDYHDIFFTCTDVINYTCLVGGCFINNSAAVVDFVGDGQSLEVGDYAKVVATLYRNEQVVGTAEKFLVNSTEEKLEVLTDWDAFKFDVAVSVDAVDFEIQTNIEGLPPYFCLDDFVASLELEY